MNTIDQRSRSPELEVVDSMGIKPNKEKLRKIFAHHAIPKRICNAEQRTSFLEEERSQHHLFTPERPRASGCERRFMQTWDGIDCLSTGRAGSGWPWEAPVFQSEPAFLSVGTRNADSCQARLFEHAQSANNRKSMNRGLSNRAWPESAFLVMTKRKAGF